MVLTVTDFATGRPAAMDQRTLDTVIAALAFYRENQLVFGSIGQLDAQLTTAFIARIEPVDRMSLQRGGGGIQCRSRSRTPNAWLIASRSTPESFAFRNSAEEVRYPVML
jgi:hypothetical protein